MSVSLVSRFAGPIALATGILFTVAELIMLGGYDVADRQGTLHNPLYLTGGFLYLPAFGGLLITLAATYQWQAQKAGLLGLIGFAAATLGTLFLAGDLWFETFAVPWLADVAPESFDKVGGLLVIGAFTSYVLFAAGWALFGIASLRARVLPMPISLAILVGGVIGFQALVPPFGLPLGLAIVWLGVWMTRASTRVAQTTSTNRMGPIAIASEGPG